MTKNQLISHINNIHNSKLNNSNTNFSNINKSKSVWWFNISTSKFDSDVNLLLNAEEYALWLFLPKGFVNQLNAKFNIRADKNAVDLEISSSINSNYLIDIKSNGSKFNFSPFVKEKIDLI